MAADLDTINSTQNAGVQYLGQLVQVFKHAFGFLGGTSASATGGSATLPANPVGFVSMTLPNGQSVKVPYYV